MITYLGWATLNGIAAAPVDMDAFGHQVFQVPQPRGFFLVVEAKPSPGGFPVGSNIYNWDMMDPTVRPDLQILTSRPLGMGTGLGSTAVCDDGPAPAPLGGIPGISPPNFALTQPVADALSDFGCRFLAHASPLESCTGDGAGSFFFQNSSSKVQFCASIGTPLTFPTGDTLITVQVLDQPTTSSPPGTGSPGLPYSVVIRVP